MNKEIKQLIDYAVMQELMSTEDIPYAVNRILDLLGLEEFEYVEYEFIDYEEPSPILEPLLDFAAEKGLIDPDTTTRRDIFEAKIMDALIDRPSMVTGIFNDLAESEGSETATDYFYHLSQKSNYIKTSRTSKNVVWKSPTKYGDLDMTINLSKPEKDPRDIIAAGNKTTRKYPKCLLCVDNVGYNGATTNIGRSSHRTIKMNLNKEPFHFQYSPYVYYNEHCIVLHEEHIPMNVSEKTFKRLFDFVDRFPHYFLGSNAGLPIVGGSILSHEHYQGGRHTFPIEKAEVLSKTTVKDVTLKQLYWPLSVIRMESTNKESLIEMALNLYNYWADYSNQDAGILAKTDAPHNAITPIARKKNDTYVLDMTLRNNRTSEEFKLGIFHPHPEHHHIKKENIGLIEVMGLAVLPARLAKELPIIKDALLNNTELPEELHVHSKWLNELKESYNNENIDTFINNQIANKFMMVIEDAGVFKQTETGKKHFDSFVEELVNVLSK